MSSGQASYHHGDLPAALRRVAAEVLVERGASGFSLREVARRAGVSHAAPAHHFTDARGLLTAVAIEGFQYLTSRTETAIEGVADPEEALVRLGQAYVLVAVEMPGHCSVMFQTDAIDVGQPAYQQWGDRAFGVLSGVIERLALERAPALDVLLAAGLCWSSMQGLVTLYEPLTHKALPGRTAPPIDELAAQFGRLMLAGFVGKPA